MLYRMEYGRYDVPSTKEGDVAIEILIAYLLFAYAAGGGAIAWHFLRGPGRSERRPAALLLGLAAWLASPVLLPLFVIEGTGR